MSQGGATPKTALVGWVFLDHHRADGFTIRWRRGEPVAYVLEGKPVAVKSNETVDLTGLAVAGWVG